MHAVEATPSDRFTDCEGRDWQCEITRGVCRRVERALRVNLIQLFDERAELVGKLWGDPALLVDVLYVVCREQADERELSDEAFGEALKGDVLEAAALALVEGIIRFFPHDQRRTILRAFLVKTLLLRELMQTETLAALHSIDVGRLASASTSSSGNAPASSA